METRFNTLSEALAAGYSKISRGDRDISTGGSFGYDFENSDGEKTVTVWLTKELNKMHLPGCFMPMYPPNK